MEEVTIETLAQQYAGREYSEIGLVELAGCVRANLGNIKRIAEAYPLVGIAWAQAIGLCMAVEKFFEEEYRRSVADDRDFD